MKTYRAQLITMWLVILVCQLGLILRTEAQPPPDECITSVTNRAPENSDITVVCGTEHMDLIILLCPVYHARYNESLMFLNNQNQNECLGTADLTVEPPVLRFRFPLNESAMESCSNNFKIINEVGTGDFSDFSNVQYVNISGTVTSLDPTSGMITYKPQVLYKFSCLYPMQYLLNNSQLGVSGVNLVINDNNGSFISTLSMQLYQDEDYQDMLSIPQTGIKLKTKIYVAVKATNLTERFNVLLDRCFATTSPYPMINNDQAYDLFVGCTRDPQTKVDINGRSQVAHFSFEAFRFVEHKNQTISTFYLHCTTRLCEVSSCSRLMPNCENNARRRKREVQEGVSGNTTVSSPAIVVGKQSVDDAQPFSASHSAASGSNYSSPVVAVIVCIVILAILLVAMAIYFALNLRRRKPIVQ